MTTKPKSYKMILPKTKDPPLQVVKVPHCKCFICDEVVQVRGVPLMQTTTQTTNVEMSKKIGQLMGERLVVVPSADDLLCRKCYSLVNHVDKMESDLLLVKKSLRNHLKRKYGMTAEQMREIAGAGETELMFINEEQEAPAKVSRFRNIKPKPTAGVQELHCPKCEFVTNDADTLMVHKMVCPSATTQYRCTMCDESFVTQKMMRNHKLQVHLSNWTCHFCDVSFTEEQEFTSHMKSHLGERLNHKIKEENEEHACKCELCEAAFKTEAELKEHLVVHGNITFHCVSCNTGFETKEEMLEHVTAHDDGSLGQEKSDCIYTCDVCSLSFLQYEMYLQHLSTHADSNGVAETSPVTCDNCGVSVEDSAALDVHKAVGCMESSPQDPLAQNDGFSTNLMDGTMVFSAEGTDTPSEAKKVDGEKQQAEVTEVFLVDMKTGSGEKTYVCGECCHSERDLALLQQHIDDVHGVYRCEICLKRLHKTELESHMEKEHSDSPVLSPIKCKKCSKTFLTRRSLHVHESEHAENLIVDCPDCDQQFTREKFLNEHRDAMHPVAKCRFCSKEFQNVKQLKSHETRHKSDKTLFNCNECNRVFQTPTGLRHHKAQHTGDYKYTCEFCKKGFVSRVRYEEHRASHTKEERYSCEICGKKFSFQATYWIHRKWHDNPTPYKCEFCDRLFKHSSLLAVHKRKHTGERPYECSHCEQTFAVGNTLKRHLMLHTGVFPHTCHVCKQGFSAKHKMAIHMSKVHQDHSLLENQLKKSNKKEFKMVVKENEGLKWVVQKKEDSEEYFTIQADEDDGLPCTLLTDDMLEMVDPRNSIVEIVMDEAKPEDQGEEDEEMADIEFQSGEALIKGEPFTVNL